MAPPLSPKKARLPPVPKKPRHPLSHIGVGRLEIINDIKHTRPHVLATIPEDPDEGPPSDVTSPPLPDYDSVNGSV